MPAIAIVSFGPVAWLPNVEPAAQSTGSFTHPVPIDPALIGPGEPPGPFKNGAFISVLYHGGHLLALDEASTCYEMTPDLDTIGEWKAGTDEPINLGAHNRRHPRTRRIVHACLFVQ